MFRRTKEEEAERLRISLRIVLLGFIILLAIANRPQNVFGTAILEINTVDVVPFQPTDTSIITFNISGRASKSPSWVETDYDYFSQDDLTFYLYLYISTNFYTSFSDWTYSKQISDLPVGTYTLEVTALNYDSPSLFPDTYTTEFTVTPEPATFFLLCGGVMAIRSFSKKKVRP